MNTDTSIERLAKLIPIDDDNLTAEAETPAARALLERIVDTSARPARRSRGRRHGRLALPAAAAIVGAVALAVTLSGGGKGGAEPAAAATLHRVAGVARTRPQLVPRPGQYLYTKSVDAYLDTTVPGGAGTAYNVLVPHVRETWLGPDGGRLYETSGTPSFLTARDRERWIADGSPSLTEPPAETPLSPAKPLDLPSDPDALYAVLAHAAAGHGDSLNGEMFTLVGDSLRETSATPAQRSALYQVVARIPGVTLVGETTDSAGRPGIAVARDDHGFRSTLVFDPQTSALLSEETIALAGNQQGFAAGTRVGYATYLVQAIVASKTSVP